MGTLFSHTDNISINVILSALPTPVTSFSTILFVDSLANSTLVGFPAGDKTSVGVNSSELIRLGSLSDMLAANTATAGSISDQAMDDVMGALSHARSPDNVQFLAVDLAGGDTYDTVFASLNDAFTDYYAVIPLDRTVANIALISEGVLAGGGRKRIVVAQMHGTDAYANEATWDANDIGQLSETEKDRLYMCFHDDAQPCAASVASWALSWDPNQYSPPWTFPVPSISKLALPSGVTTTTFKANLDTNYINHPLPLAGTDVFIDPGLSQNSRPMYVIVTADWFEARLSEALQTLKVKYASMGIKLPMNTFGQNLILSKVQAIYSMGVQAGHFLSRDDADAVDKPVVIKAETISPDDQTNQELRFTVKVPILLDARILTLNVTVQQ
jgi:hypothetical protein